jgi:serine/threonine protein kinase
MSLDPSRLEDVAETVAAPAAAPDSEELRAESVAERDPACDRQLSEAELTELLSLHPQPSANASKQERDFVLASLLLRRKHLSERQLRLELKNWTPFGSLPLQDFLAGRKLVSAETLTRLGDEVETYLRSLESRCSWRSAATAAGRTSSLLERIDPSGRLAKVLGLSKVPKAVIGTGTRSFRTKYQLLRKIGQGGLGTVWLAVDTSLNRYVAVKEVSGDGAHHAVAIARFRREAEITGRLDHPSIVPIHVLGEDESDGRVFYVMRFLGNETLDDAIREYHEQRELGRATPLAFHRLMTAFVSVCQAIAYAHSHKVIHRDLKPQNIALDGFGQVIVLDWGLAKTLGLDSPESEAVRTTKRDSPDDLDVTFVGQVVGTPVYMAPEQAAGRVDDIDERTDVYGLGAILFAILTGYAPHESTHESLAAGTQISSLFDLIVDQPTTAPRQLNPHIHVTLEAICLKAMAKDRRLRYASAAELSEDIQRWMADEPVSAIHDRALTRTRRWMRGHRHLSKLLACAAMLVVGAGLFVANDLYRTAIAEKQMRLKTVADEARKVRGRLAFEFEMMSKNVRFMASVPPVQAFLESLRSADPDALTEPTERLKRIYSGLLEVNPHYSAVSYWIDDGPERTLLAVSSSRSRPHQRRLTEAALSQHGDAVRTLSKGHVFSAVPRVTFPTGPQDRSSDAASTVTSLTDVFVGVEVQDEDTEADVGGVAIECDLERLLQICTSSVSIPGTKVILVDDQGAPLLRFTREGGLESNTSPLPGFPPEPVIASYLAGISPSEITVVSRVLCAARIPLDDRGRFIGLIVTFPEVAAERQ